MLNAFEGFDELSKSNRIQYLQGNKTPTRNNRSMPLMFFGQAQEIVGTGKSDWPALVGDSNASFPATAGELRTRLLHQFAELKNLSSLAIAVNAEYAEEDTLIQESDEIALIPPVSGG